MLLCGHVVRGFAAQVEAELILQLRADYAALQQTRVDFEQAREARSLGSTEEADYAAWVRHLNDQFVRDCQRLTSIATTPLPDDLPCNRVTASNPAPVLIDTTAEHTKTGDTARMVEQLTDSLGEFDERLLQEQDRIKARQPRSEFAGGATDAGQADGSNLPGNTGSGDRTADQATGKPQPGAKRGIPADIPDGSNDDVVARQLREAAQKETDPELKKKLWEEYRRYKAGIG